MLKHKSCSNISRPSKCLTCSISHDLYSGEYDILYQSTIAYYRYDGAKIGIFMHFGPYSVPSFSSEWFWSSQHEGSKEVEAFMKDNYPPGFKYHDFGPELKMEFFDADQFADLVKASGAK